MKYVPDVVQVVRCKDCKHLNYLYCPLSYIEQHEIRMICRPPEWFCADGERKDEDASNDPGN